MRTAAAGLITPCHAPSAPVAISQTKSLLRPTWVLVQTQVRHYLETSSTLLPTAVFRLDPLVQLADFFGNPPVVRGEVPPARMPGPPFREATDVRHSPLRTRRRRRRDDAQPSRISERDEPGDARDDVRGRPARGGRPCRAVRRDHRRRPGLLSRRRPQGHGDPHSGRRSAARGGGSGGEPAAAGRDFAAAAGNAEADYLRPQRRRRGRRNERRPLGRPSHRKRAGADRAGLREGGIQRGLRWNLAAAASGRPCQGEGALLHVRAHRAWTRPSGWAS